MEDTQKGNINDIKKHHKDWFMGSFISQNSIFNTNKCSNFEIKWSNHKANVYHPADSSPLVNDLCNSLVILIYGRVRLGFFYNDSSDPDDYLLEQEGDYVYWKPDRKQEIEALEDSLVLTVRWYK